MGKLEGRIAIVTGAAKGSAAASHSRSRTRAAQWRSPLAAGEKGGGGGASARAAGQAAAKAGVHGLTRAMAWELAPYNITVNAIAPGPLDTDVTRSLPARLVSAQESGTRAWTIRQRRGDRADGGAARVGRRRWLLHGRD